MLGGESFKCCGHTDATKLKQSIASTGREVSQATREKLSKSQKGIKKPFSPEALASIREKRKNRPSPTKGLTGIYSEETLEKMCRTYEFISPDGNVITVKNLIKFCRENDLSYEGMKRTANGYHLQHRGYTANPPKQMEPVKYHCKNWKFIYDGCIVEIQNLKKFCKENNLNYKSMVRVERGETTVHKGYTKYCEDVKLLDNLSRTS